MMAARMACGVASRGAVEIAGVARRSRGADGCRACRVACVAGARVSRELQQPDGTLHVPLLQV